MSYDSEVSRIIAGRGLAALRQVDRKLILAKEYDTNQLPPELVRSDGSLDLYPDVLTHFTPTFSKGLPAIQCGGWVGYIPLNDTYALQVSPRVPIGNLERIIGLARDYDARVLEKYTRQFSHTNEQPESLTDVLTDQLLRAFDLIVESGLLKTYERRTAVGAAPIGRINAFETAWRSKKSGLPIAVSSSFGRTRDFSPNRMLKAAFAKLLSLYRTDTRQSQRARILRVQKALGRLEDISAPGAADITSGKIGQTLRHLSPHHESYADALMLAQLIISDSGIAIRGNEGGAVLPSIIINMAEVFEAYVRRILADNLGPRVSVRDGNKGEPAGAALQLFEPLRASIKNPDVTPDIVVEIDGSPRLIIDAKYKHAPANANSNHIQQVMVYGARYGTKKVMLLFAGRAASEPSVIELGSIGPFEVFHAGIDLNASDIHTEEKRLANAVAALL